MSARSRRMHGSMGSSWDNADYSSDGASIHTASDDVESDASLEQSQDEMLQEYTDKATPLLSQSTGPSVPQSHEAATSTPTRATARHSQMASSQTTPRNNSARSSPRSSEPSLIMPRASVSGSLNSLMEGYASGTPTRNSQPRSRSQRQPSSRKSPVTSSKMANRRSSKTNHAPEEQEELGPWHYVHMFYLNLALPLLAYLWDIFGYANRHFFKPILSVALAVAIILFGLRMASSVVYSKISTALAPVCLVPGSSYLFSMCATLSSENQANFEELINVQSHFEDILDASNDASDLPATIKDSQMAIRDLRTLVRHSQLPSRHQLDMEFENFVATASEASTDLSRYNARIGAVVDRIINTNTWTMNVLRGIESDDKSIGAVGRIYNAMTGAFVSAPPTLEQRIFDQYVLHVNRDKEEIGSLIRTAQALLAVLTNMDERLDTIYSIAMGDDIAIRKKQDELLSHLWTKLGGNSVSVKANNRKLNLLENVSIYRRRALKHVSETLLKLQGIQAELETLHEGVSAPDVLGYRDSLPVAYHVDLIQRGVERLSAARGDARRIESKQIRKLMHGSKDDEGVRELPAGRSTPLVTAKGV
ncbi:hypothetical protein BDU57DRAFT_519345 [Ampelomyces quisqualis]|uniref:Uncharacterized protein n=1 Tax=Ampelomyces quisqualis TaxID=50730 RepID=A0A6A5QIN8_AMPQU|nr:hypothetical protein BDU57DRAFT_519345 [Ampelomyces quisqualis]